MWIPLAETVKIVPHTESEILTNENEHERSILPHLIYDINTAAAD